jgi:hypothetical protein
LEKDIEGYEGASYGWNDFGWGVRYEKYEIMKEAEGVSYDGMDCDGKGLVDMA